MTASTAADSLDQDDVLALIERGEIVPLQTLLQRHRDRLQGRLIDLELEHEHGRLVYELELIDAEGVVREYLIDAKSGEWLGQE
ncbi:MAG: PepSY domain-containing protein [Halopseudomonas sp.]